MLYTTPTSAEATTPTIITTQQMVRVTFGKKWTNAGPVAKAISEALKRTYPTVAFRTRYRTATTYISPSWVECAWPGPPNEAEATAVISVALRKVRL